MSAGTLLSWRVTLPKFVPTCDTQTVYVPVWVHNVHARRRIAHRRRVQHYPLVHWWSECQLYILPRGGRCGSHRRPIDRDWTCDVRRHTIELEGHTAEVRAHMRHPDRIRARLGQRLSVHEERIVRVSRVVHPYIRMLRSVRVHNVHARRRIAHRRRVQHYPLVHWWSECQLYILPRGGRCGSHRRPIDRDWTCDVRRHTLELEGHTAEVRAHMRHPDRIRARLGQRLSVHEERIVRVSRVVHPYIRMLRSVRVHNVHARRRVAHRRRVQHYPLVHWWSECQLYILPRGGRCGSHRRPIDRDWTCDVR